ncbi:MAG TPA: LamG-like jellyroll fold domain-containing protein, partial [Kofleriaceae bacterium]|nr:LamG-like jellyroll fold domain-containing protein [Kofleriaceae bacterium]
SWTFIACTYDGDNLCAHRFTSSGNHDSFCHGDAGQPNQTGAHGLAIGHLSNSGNPIDRFDGDIDSVQVYSRALTRADLCAVAAQPATCLN